MAKKLKGRHLRRGMQVVATKETGSDGFSQCGKLMTVKLVELPFVVFELDVYQMEPHGGMLKPKEVVKINRTINIRSWRFKEVGDDFVRLTALRLPDNDFQGETILR